MGLLDITILMGDACVVPGRLQAVVPHEGQVSLGEGFLLIAGQMPNGCAQMVGAMLNWNASDLPERLLNADHASASKVSPKHTRTASTWEYVSTKW